MDNFRLMWQNHRTVIIVLSLFAVFALIISVMSLRNQKPVDPGAFVVDAVEFEDGSNKVRIERSGKITIYTPHGVFTRYWDQDRTQKFFSTLDNLDEKALNDSAYQKNTEGKIGFWITLVLKDGRTIRFFVEEGSSLAQQLAEIIDQVQNILEDAYKEILEKPQASTTPTPLTGGSAGNGGLTPTPIPSTPPTSSSLPNANPTPSSSGTGGSSGGGNKYEAAYQQGNKLGGTTQEVFKCEDIVYDNERPRIVSNVNCEPVEQSE